MQNLTFDLELLWSYILNILFLILIGIIILIIGHFLKKFLKRISRRFPTPLNSVLSLLTFLQIIIWVLFIVYLFNPPLTVIISGSTLIVAVIGISALGGFGSNILGGLWIMFTHPYGVGDFITSANNPQYSGLVIDFSINYTKILRLNRKVVIVPNGIMVNSIISNSNIIFDKNYIVEHHLESNLLSKENNGKNKQNIIPANIIDSIFYGEYVYFTFNIEIKLESVKPEPTIETVEYKLEQVCERFAPEFGFKPEYYFVDFSSRMLITIKIITKDPRLIIYKYSDMIQEIANKLYLDKFFEDGK